ncbi:MAG: FAD-dependent oxidoreductase [Desulfurella sp.]|uniref:oxidoreductase n=1 Tax=Desulfurella sp. TaxID=1962857 RepID=UPI003C8227C8
MNNLLFTPFNVSDKVFKNRLIMLPTVTNYANVDGSVNQKNIDFYSLRQNLAAIIIEAAYTNIIGKSFTNQIGIDSDDKIEGLARLSKTIHNNDSYAGIQLALNVKSKTINELSEAEIEEIKNSFVKAAERAIDANFDIIEIHCAHGWLLGQFLSNYFNKRSDSFGGNLENRMKLPLEIIKLVRDTAKNHLISVRMNACDFVQDGINLDESSVFALNLKEIGIDLLSVSCGIGAKTFTHVSPLSYPKGFLLDFAHEIKLKTKLPVLAANRLNDYELANYAIEFSKADFIGLARSLIADPKIAKKWQIGEFKDVVPCIACNQACIASIQSQKEASCVINPKPYQAKVFQQPFMYKRKIMIIGAGPAGLSFGIFAKQKGLNCIIFEKHATIGGQINLAIKPPHKQEFKKMLNYFEYRTKKLGIPINTKTEVDVDLIKSEKPDVVVFALGSSPYIPEFAANNEFVLNADEVLEFGLPPDTKSVGILGGGLVGLETANFLAEEGISVSVFEMENKVLQNMAEVLRVPVIESLHSNIKIFLNHKLKNIEVNKAIFETKDGVSEKVFDYFVLSLGRTPNIDLISKINFCMDTIEIGDCKKPSDAFAAITDAYNAAQLI